MIRRLRTLMLVFVLLVQGYGNAWASMPMAQVSEPGAAQMAEQAQLPCHETMQQAERDHAMPCCGDDCRCAQGCFSNAALVPNVVELHEYLAIHFETLAAQPHLLPAHPRLLIRPPATSGS